MGWSTGQQLNLSHLMCPCYAVPLLSTISTGVAAGFFLNVSNVDRHFAQISVLADDISAKSFLQATISAMKSTMWPFLWMGVVGNAAAGYLTKRKEFLVSSGLMFLIVPYTKLVLQPNYIDELLNKGGRDNGKDRETLNGYYKDSNARAWLALAGFFVNVAVFAGVKLL